MATEKRGAKTSPKAALEAILFASGDYVEEDALIRALDISKDNLKKYIDELTEDCEVRGIQVLELDGAYQLSTRPEYYTYVQKATEQSRAQALSPAAMEVLAIVAYKQPVTKSQVDFIRGVDSTSPLGRLVASGLVEGVGKLDAPGRPTLYATTRAFLRTFGLKDLSGLPDIGMFDLLDTDAAAEVRDTSDEETEA